MQIFSQAAQMVFDILYGLDKLGGYIVFPTDATYFFLNRMPVRIPHDNISTDKIPTNKIPMDKIPNDKIPLEVA